MSTSRMRVMVLNAENLFLANNSNALVGKSRVLVTSLAKSLLYYSPDLLFLSEVGGKESLEIFNKDYLNDIYDPYLLPGNSERGIELGVLKKKELAFKSEHHTHVERILSNDKSIAAESEIDRLFSRDCLEFHLYQKENKRLIFFFVHLKSQWDRSGEDFRGFKQRAAEIQTLVEIYRERYQQYPESLIFVAGDFNGRAQKDAPDREFLPIYNETDLQDLFEWQGLSLEKRRTVSLFDKNNNLLPPEHMQLDYVFFSHKCLPFVDLAQSGRVPFLGKEGSPLPFPETPQAKKARPSDHYPLVWDIVSLESFSCQ